MFDSIFMSPDDAGFDQAVNPIRDWAFKGALGEETGESAYNWFTLGTGVVAFGKSGYDLYKSGDVRNILRKPQAAKAVKNNIPLKTKIYEFGDKLLIHTVDATSNSAIPMITRKVIIDLKKLSEQGIFIGVDLRNNGGTIKNIMDND